MNTVLNHQSRANIPGDLIPAVYVIYLLIRNPENVSLLIIKFEPAVLAQRQPYQPDLSAEHVGYGRAQPAFRHGTGCLLYYF